MNTRRTAARALGRAAMAATLAVAGLMALPGEGAAGAQPAPGSKPAIFHDGTWYLRSTLSTGRRPARSGTAAPVTCR